MSDEEEHSKSEFYYLDECEFLDNGDLTENTKETAKKRLKLKEAKKWKHNKENSQRHKHILILFITNKQGR